MDSHSTAVDFLKRGWSVVPVPYRSKKPILDKWEQLRIGETEIPYYFSARRQNVGVLLGEPSGWLIDVDLDHELAVELAEIYLPPTRSIFGRKTKRRSHWLYFSSAPVATRQRRLPDRKMVVELRSTGGQTVFPGSVHTSGEPIEWDVDGHPAVADPCELLLAVQNIYTEVCRQLNVVARVNTSTNEPGNISAPDYILDRARKYIAKMPIAISGQGGHSSTYHVTCVLTIGFGLDRGDTLAILREWNERCEPPWSERELEHKVDDALKESGWRGYLLGYGKRPNNVPTMSAIDRANRHAIEHRRRELRRARR